VVRLVRGDAAVEITVENVYLDAGFDDGDEIVGVAGWELVVRDLDAVARIRHATRDAADRALHAAVAKYQARVSDPPAVASTHRFTSFPELERVVEDQPDDPAALDVLADAWLDAGDPRGACVRTGNVQDARDAIANALGDEAYRVSVEVRNGLVAAIFLNDERGVSRRSTRDVLATLLAHPFARFLHWLAIRNAPRDALAAALAQHHPALRALAVTLAPDDRDQVRDDDPCVDAAELDRAYPRLEALELIVPRLAWGDAQLPHVTRFAVHAAMAPDDGARLHAWRRARPWLRHAELSVVR